jgi:hypothetical protein
VHHAHPVSPERPRVGARLGVGAFVVALVLAVAPFLAGPAHGAPLPGTWCGPGESTADLPDTVVGAQIHVIYAYGADMPDRSDVWAPRIARDLAGVDGWWQREDSTRAPRFDLADFPCDTTFGRLDITTFPLPNPTAAYNASDRAGAVNALTLDVAKQFGTTAMGKAYLVYLDLPVPAIGATVCGITRRGASSQPNFANGMAFVFLRPESSGCGVGNGAGSGNGWPARTAAHELLHLISGSLVGAPHVCPDDTGHICDPPYDILQSAGGPGQTTLGQAGLDPGRDDYYGHGIVGRFDARNSAWLAHLDAPQYAVSAAPPTNGRIVSLLPGIDCPARCSAAWDADTTVQLSATAAPGYAFVNWAGDCQGVYDVCTVTADSARFVLAVFAPLQPFEVRVKGPGIVVVDGADCARMCSTDEPLGTAMELTARPDRKASFAGWSDRCREDAKHCVAVVKKRNVIVASFTKRRR